MWYLYLAVEALAICQRDMEHHGPVAKHIEVECTAILARRDFLGFAKDWAHSRVRHVTFERNSRPGQPLVIFAAQDNREGVQTNARRLGIAVAGKSDGKRSPCGSGTAGRL